MTKTNGRAGTTDADAKQRANRELITLVNAIRFRGTVSEAAEILRAALGKAEAHGKQIALGEMSSMRRESEETVRAAEAGTCEIAEQLAASRRAHAAAEARISSDAKRFDELIAAVRRAADAVNWDEFQAMLPSLEAAVEVPEPVAMSVDGIRQFITAATGGRSLNDGTRS